MIPFNRSSILGDELTNISRAVDSRVISGEGHFGRRCEKFISQLLGPNCPVLLVPSCTAALEMCALLLELGPGDEVIMPSFTFVSTANAFAIRGVKPVFVDIDPQHLNVSPQEIAAAITDKTKAIVVVHYAGVACDMPEICKISHSSSVPIVEDAAHALGATFQQRQLGSFGAFATFSFHETKNVTCGEGGALVINDESFVERAYHIRDKGTNRRNFQRGETPFYSWVDLGSSYVISDILAAFLYAQLEHLEHVNSKRQTLWSQYHELLRPLEKVGKLSLPDAAVINECSAHAFYVLSNSFKDREELRTRLLQKGIQSVSHYQPLHKSPFVVKQWGEQPKLPVTEDISQRILRLPLYFSLSDEDLETVVREIYHFFGETFQ